MAWEDLSSGGKRWRYYASLLACGFAVVIAMVALNRRADAQFARKLFATPIDDAWKDTALTAKAAVVAQRLYGRDCVACHGADMHGDRRSGAPDLIDGDWLYGTGKPSEIEQTILYGVRSGHKRSRNLADMPAFGTPRPYKRYAIPPLRPDEIGDVADYVRQLSGRGGSPAAVTRGRALFDGKGQCYDCHGPDGHGDENVGAPNLADRIWLYGSGSRDSVIDSIAGGRAGMCPAWIGRIGPEGVRSLAIYIAGRAPRAAGPASLTGD